MNFEEWKEENFFKDKHRSTDWDNPDLVAAWNAALDEAVKVANNENSKWGGTSINMALNNVSGAIKELKE